MVLFYGYSSLQSPVSQPPSLEFGNYFKGSLNDAPQLSVDDLDQFSDIERSKFVSDGSCDAELRNSLLLRLSKASSIQDALLANVVNAAEGIKFYYVVVRPSVVEDEFGRRMWESEKPFFAASKFFEPLVASGSVLKDPGYTLLPKGSYIFAFFSNQVELCQNEFESASDLISRDGFNLVAVEDGLSTLDAFGNELEILSVYRTNLIKSVEVKSDLDNLKPGFIGKPNMLNLLMI